MRIYAQGIGKYRLSKIYNNGCIKHKGVPCAPLARAPGEMVKRSWMNPRGMRNSPIARALKDKTEKKGAAFCGNEGKEAAAARLVCDQPNIYFFISLVILIIYGNPAFQET